MSSRLSRNARSSSSGFVLRYPPGSPPRRNMDHYYGATINRSSQALFTLVHGSLEIDAVNPANAGMHCAGFWKHTTEELDSRLRGKDRVREFRGTRFLRAKDRVRGVRRNRIPAFEGKTESRGSEELDSFAGKDRVRRFRGTGFTPWRERKEPDVGPVTQRR